jgi:transcriptional regulator with XRE-family HTH domain
MMNREILRQIRAHRAEVGLTQEQAAELADMQRDTWLRYETGRRDASVVMLRRMAKAVGLEIEIPDPPPPPPRPAPQPRMATPLFRRFMDKIRAQREALGLSQDEAGRRAGIHKQTWGNLERGHHVGQHVTVERLHAAAGAVGLRLALVPESHEVLMDLTEHELRAVIRVAQHYRRIAPRNPPVFRSAMDKIERRTESESEAA